MDQAGIFYYYGLYANAHRGKARKAGRPGLPVQIEEEDSPPVPPQGWATRCRTTRWR